MENPEDKSRDELLHELEQLKVKLAELEKSGNSKALNSLNEDVLVGEKQYRLIIKNMMNGYAYHQIVLDDNGKAVDYLFLDVNHGFEKLTGLKKKDIIGKKTTEVFPLIANDPADWIGRYGKVANNGHDIKFESFSVPLQKWFSVYAYCPEKNYFVTFFEDISGQKEADAELKKYKALHENTEKMAKIGGWTFDVETLTQNWSDEIFRILEMDLSKGTPMVPEGLDFIDAPYRQMAEEAIQNSISKGESYNQEWLLTTAKGNKRWVHSVAEPIVINGKTINVSGSFQDITERKEIELALKIQTGFLDKIIESSALSTWISDGNGTAIRTNSACLNFFGATEDEVIGKYNLFNDKVIEEQGFMPEIRNVFEKGKVANIMIDYDFGAVDHVNVKAATHKIINSIFTPIFDDHGQVSNVIVQSIDLSVIKRAEKIAIEERNKSKQYLDIADIMLLSLDNSGIIRLINPKGCEILGYSKEELLGQNWFDKFHPEHEVEQVKEVARKLFSGESESVNYYENVIITKSGDERLIAWHNSVLKDENGAIVGTLSSGEDITEQKRAIRELSESKNFFEQLFYQSSTSTQLLDRDGWCVRINPKLSELFGVQPADIEGKKYNILTDGEIIRTGVIEKLQRVFNHKETIRWEVNFDIEHASRSTGVKVSKPEKRWFNNLAYPILDDDGQLIYVIIQHDDITMQKNAEEALRESEEKFRNLSKISPVGIFVTDADGKTVYWNDLLCEITGMSTDDAKGTGWVDGIHPDDKERVFSEWYKSAEARSSFNQEYRFVDQNGKITWTIGRAVPLKDPAGELIGFVGSISDITRQKHLENELKQHQENLEELVKQRTIELEIKNKKLDDAMKAFVGREITIRNLQERIKSMGGQ